MQGRKRTPTHLKLVRGNPGRRPINDAEPQPPAATLDAPEHLSRYAREAWITLARVLDQMGVLTSADALALEHLVECYAEVRECRLALELAGGPTYETKSVTGELMYRTRPEAARLADADRRFKGYLGEFGLTPAARTKIKVESGGKVDPLDAYFAS